MHPFRPVVLAGIGFAMLAMLLPFVSFPVVGSVDGSSADAWPALIPLTPVALFALTGRWDRSLDVLPGVAAVTLSGSSLIFALVKLADSVVAARDTPGATLGPGSWALTTAATVTLAGAVYGYFSKS